VCVCVCVRMRMCVRMRLHVSECVHACVHAPGPAQQCELAISQPAGSWQTYFQFLDSRYRPLCP